VGGSGWVWFVGWIGICGRVYISTDPHICKNTPPPPHTNNNNNDNRELRALHDTNTTTTNTEEENEEEGARGGLVLIFTSSLDSTHRLCRLLQLFGLASSSSPTTTTISSSSSSSGIHEFSSSLSQPQRAKLIQRCLAKGGDAAAGGGGRVRVLVASDGMARGMDLPNVAAVVNYDVPTQVGGKGG
jgi:superfamily II DNA/RNA helicase